MADEFYEIDCPLDGVKWLKSDDSDMIFIEDDGWDEIEDEDGDYVYCPDCEDAPLKTSDYEHVACTCCGRTFSNGWLKENVGKWTV